MWLTWSIIALRTSSRSCCRNGGGAAQSTGQTLRVEHRSPDTFHLYSATHPMSLSWEQYRHTHKLNSALPNSASRHEYFWWCRSWPEDSEAQPVCHARLFPCLRAKSCPRALLTSFANHCLDYRPERGSFPLDHDGTPCCRQTSDFCLPRLDATIPALQKLTLHCRGMQGYHDVLSKMH